MAANRSKIGLGAIFVGWLVEFMSILFQANRGVFLFDWRGVVFAGLVWRIDFRNRCEWLPNAGLSEIRKYRYFRISGGRVF
jgi:hypothetical protein